MHRLAGVTATVVSGVLYGLAFPTTRLHALAWVALVPLFAAVRGASRRGAILLAWLWTLVAAYTLGDWFPGTVSTYFDQPRLVGIAFFVGVSTLMAAGYFMAFALCYRRLAGGTRKPAPLLVAAAWVAAELARARLLTGNPLGLLGYSQVGVEPLVQIADVTGVYGISFMLAAVNAALLDLGLALTTRARALGPALAALARAGLVVAAIAGYGLLRLETPLLPPDAPAVKVAIAQGNADLGSLWQPGFYGTNLDIYLRLTLQALRDEEPAVVFWPESAMSFFLGAEPAYRSSIGTTLSRGHAQLVAGGPRTDGTGRASYYNTIFLLAPEGTVVATYDKVHLLPFAEYFPLPSFDFLRRRFARVREFQAGTPPTAPMPTVAGPAAVAICNEAMFPEIVAARVRQGATYIVNPTNDTWLSPKFSAQLFDMVALRAIEQRRYLVRASTSGPSAILDPFGRAAGKTEPFTSTMTAGWVRAVHTLTPYGRVGDLFAGLSAGVALAAWAYASRGR